MAAWQFQRRLVSLFLTQQPHLPLRNEPLNQLLPIACLPLGRDGFRKRGIQTLVESSKQVNKDADRNGTCNLKAGSASALFNPIKRGLQTLVESSKQVIEDADRNGTCNLKAGSTSALSNPISNEMASVSYNATSSFKISPRHDLAMMFTCKVCETRNMKTMCRESYEKGVVVARCGGCDNLHLIADHLGWFGEPGSIEEFLAARGEEVKKGSVDTFNLTLEDLAGKKS